MNTINNGIPFVPENTIDPAAGLNISLNTIDALLQVLVQTVGANTPPTGIEGQRHIVGTAPTGVWAGQANKLARFLDGVWSFFDARHVLNAADGFWYVRSGSAWVSSPLPANVAALAGLAGAADRLPYFTGEGALSLTTLTALARTLLDDTTQGQMRSTLGLSVGDSPTFTSLTLTNGQIAFPATQVPSANANTLDDYEEGTWTPVLTFATPGDLSVSYSIQSGVYIKIGSLCLVSHRLTTSTFTHTSASGFLRVAGLPFTPSTNHHGFFADIAGVTKGGGYTQFGAMALTSGNIEFIANGSGVARSQITASDMPTGGSINILVTVIYRA